MKRMRDAPSPIGIGWHEGACPDACDCVEAMLKRSAEISSKRAAKRDRSETISQRLIALFDRSETISQRLIALFDRLVDDPDYYAWMSIRGIVSKLHGCESQLASLAAEASGAWIAAVVRATISRGRSPAALFRSTGQLITHLVRAAFPEGDVNARLSAILLERFRRTLTIVRVPLRAAGVIPPLIAEIARLSVEDVAFEFEFEDAIYSMRLPSREEAERIVEELDRSD